MPVLLDHVFWCSLCLFSDNSSIKGFTCTTPALPLFLLCLQILEATLELPFPVFTILVIFLFPLQM